MSFRSCLGWCVSAFLLGAMYGQGRLPQLSFEATPVTAANPDATAADKLFQELSKDNVVQEVSRTLSKVAALATPSVVHIQSQRQVRDRGQVEETGSGVIVGSTKHSGLYVVTNRHVIDGAQLNAIAISLHDGRIVQPQQVWSDRPTDVAVLKLPISDAPPARWADSDRLEIGHMVVAVGSPFGLSHSVTSGIISAKGRRSLQLSKGTDLLNQDFLQTDAAINPGNSGGPLIDLQGRVIAINTAIASSGGGNEGIGFSIPSNLVRRVMDQLLDHGEVRRSYLGVHLDPDFTVGQARRLGLGRLQGSLVKEVYPNTPAQRAGLAIDDVVLKFDGIDVEDENHLIHLVSLTPIGTTVRLTVWRNRAAADIEVRLIDRKAFDRGSDNPPASSTPSTPRQQGSR